MKHKKIIIASITLSVVLSSLSFASWRDGSYIWPTHNWKRISEVTPTPPPTDTNPPTDTTTGGGTTTPPTDSTTPPTNTSELLTFKPTEASNILVNPYMGPAPRATSTNPIASSLVFNYVSWKDLEPTKGVIDFASFETKNRLVYWGSKNIKMIIRVHMDYPRSYAHIDIPDWLYQEIGGDGTTYNKSVDGSYGMGFSPNYNNAKIIAYHRELIRKLGERYNNDPRIAFIELGSVGHWGEWHTYRGSSLVIPFPKTAISDQYVQPYLDYFSNKRILMRRLLPITKTNSMGMFNDEFGNYNQTYTWWLNRINTAYFDPIIGEQMPSWSDYWKYNVVGGENTIMDSMSNSFPAVLQAAKDIHLSYTKSDFSLSDPATLANATTFYKTIGYRFVVQSASIKSIQYPGETANINIEINNKGVAPFYYNWPIELSLINSSGAVSLKTNINQDIRTWMPGITSFSTSLTIPTTITPGTYSLAIAAIDPEKGTPGINFANDGRTADGRYILGKFNINTR